MVIITSPRRETESSIYYPTLQMRKLSHGYEMTHSRSHSKSMARLEIKCKLYRRACYYPLCLRNLSSLFQSAWSSLKVSENKIRVLCLQAYIILLAFENWILSFITFWLFNGCFFFFFLNLDNVSQVNTFLKLYNHKL